MRVCAFPTFVLRLASRCLAIQLSLLLIVVPVAGSPRAARQPYLLSRIPRQRRPQQSVQSRTGQGREEEKKAIKPRKQSGAAGAHRADQAGLSSIDRVAPHGPSNWPRCARRRLMRAVTSYAHKHTARQLPRLTGAGPRLHARQELRRSGRQPAPCPPDRRGTGRL